MPTEEATWTVDVCTCTHPVTEHEDDGRGRCTACAQRKSWARAGVAPLCTRYQWNGEPRRRTW